MPKPEDGDARSSRKRALDDRRDDDATDRDDEEARRAAVKAALGAMTKGDWRSLMRSLGATVFALSNNASRVMEFANEAVTLVLEDRKKWDPRRGKLLTFLRVVVRTLVDDYFDSSAVQHEAAPDSDRDENVPHSSPNVLGAMVALEERDESNERFAELTTELERSPNGMAIVRCAQQGLRAARDQATDLGVPEPVVYEARKRVVEAFKAVYARHPEAPRLPEPRPRGVHAAGRRATKEENEK